MQIPRILLISCVRTALGVGFGLAAGATGAQSQEFPGPQLIPSAGAPRGLAAGDFDSDGFLDLAATSPRSSRILIHPGRGTGNFVSPRSHFVGGSPVDLAATDFDRDGLLDLVWVDEVTGDVGAMLQRDTLPVSYELRRARGADEPSDVFIHDFDGDGWPDAAVAQRGADQYAIYPNLQGHFGQPTVFPAGDGPELLALVEAGAAPELVVLQTGYLSRDIVTLDVTTGQVVRQLPLEGPTWVETGQFGESQTTDLFVLDGAAGQTRVFSPGPGGTLEERASWAVEEGSRVLRLLQPTSSGPRYLVGESERGSATVFAGEGIPARSNSWFVGDQIRDVLLADFDRDGADELVTSLPGLDALQVLQPWGEGFLGYETFASARTPAEFRLRDPGSDPQEISVLCAGSAEVWSYRVEGNALAQFESVGVHPDAIRHFWVDIDSDGRQDLVTLVARAGIQTLRNNGGGYDPPVDYVVDGELRDLWAVDLVGSPAVDLLVANSTLAGVLVYEGDGQGSFALADTVVFSDAPARVRSADLDLNGLDDLVVLGVVGQVAIVFRRESGLSSPVSFAVSDEPRDADFGDFNGDPYPDILVGNAGASTYSTINSVVQGIYSPGTVGRVTPSGAQRVFATDIDDNGQDDIIFASPNSQYLSYHLNTGSPEDPTGVFSIPIRLRAAVLPLDFTLVEVDGDGKEDILVADAVSNVLVTLRSDPSRLVPSPSLQIDGRRIAVGVELQIRGTAATSAEFEVVRESDGERLTPARVEVGLWRVEDELGEDATESYRILDRSGNLLASYEVPLLTGVASPSTWRMLPAREVDGVAEIRFRVNGGRQPLVHIYDLRGRQVTALGSRHEGEGWHRATWSGEDDRGRSVARGRYFAVVRVEGRSLRGSLLRP